jgi:uncharacterized protein (TIGR02246 family)
VSDDVRRLLAYEEIRQLVARYAVAIDSRDLDALVALFVDDVQVGKDARGRDALRSFFDGSLREIRRSILNVGTHVIDLVDDDHATGVVYCRGEIEIPGDDGGADRWVVQAIQYRDDYERRDGHWLIVRRRHLLWYGRDVGTSPIGLPAAEWPANHVGTGELPEAWGSWREFWATDGGSPNR